MSDPSSDASNDGRNALTARDALDHSWNWFKHHADQRLTMIRFAVLVAGGIAAGVGYLLKEKQFFLCILLSILGALVSYCFLRLDARTSDLIKVGERALIAIEATLANTLTTPQMYICVEADRKESDFLYSYRQNIKLILRSVIIIYIIVFLYCTIKWIGG